VEFGTDAWLSPLWKWKLFKINNTNIIAYATIIRTSKLEAESSATRALELEGMDTEVMITENFFISREFNPSCATEEVR